MILSVPHFQQENPVTCIPACVRMVLAYWGIEQDEIELSAILDSGRRGTSVLNVELIPPEWGVTCSADEIPLETLTRALDEQVPVIVGVWTNSLPWWRVNRPHAVVVVGYDDTSIYLNDPKFPDAPKTVKWNEFLTAWEEFGRFGAVIHKQRPSDKPFDRLRTSLRTPQ